MFEKNRFAAILVGVALAIAPAFAQELPRSEVSVQAFGNWTKSTTDDFGVRQSSTNSGGVLGNYRYFFSNNHGVELNYGWSRNTQSYGQSIAPVAVQADSHEATAAYVYRHKFLGIVPFVEAGGGALIFNPTNSITSQARATFVYGGGADFPITNRVIIRAEYRGLVYNSPTFDLPSTNGFDRVTHRAEPSIGFGYRF